MYLFSLNVNKLHFGNIKAVMAMGDSMTAAFAAKADPVEYRGISYSTGGDDDANSLATFMQNYNPNITGMGYNTTVPLTPFCAGLNCAVSGAVVQDIPDQLKHLMNHLNTAYLSVKYQWKVLTLFIGANNACGCTHSSNQPDQYEENLRTALTYMHGNLSHTFVNVMTLFNISGVWDLAQTSTYCKTVVPTLHECSCLYKNATQRTVMDELAMEMNVRTYKVVAEIQALQDPYFTAVVQPGVDSMRIGTLTENFLSDVDCFHPSYCAHQGFALALWNNMNTPADQKAHDIDMKNPPPYKCPGQFQYIQ